MNSNFAGIKVNKHNDLKNENDNTSDLHQLLSITILLHVYLPPNVSTCASCDPVIPLTFLRKVGNSDHSLVTSTEHIDITMTIYHNLVL